MEALKILELIPPSEITQKEKGVKDPGYHTYKCLETHQIGKNVLPPEHLPIVDCKPKFPETESSVWSSNLEVFGNKTKISQNPKSVVESTQQRIYRNSPSNDHQLAKKSTYTLIQNLKYPVFQTNETNFKDMQIVHRMPSPKPKIGQLATKTLKRALQSPFKKPKLLAIHATQLIGRKKNKEMYGNSKPTYLTLKPQKENNAQKLIDKRTVTKLAFKPATKDEKLSVPSGSTLRAPASKNAKESPKYLVIAKEKTKKGSLDSIPMSQTSLCKHGIYIGPSREPTPKVSVVALQTLEEIQESKVNIAKTIKNVSSNSKANVCPLASMEVKRVGSNKIELKSNSKVLVNLPYSKSCVQTQNTTTQYRIKDDEGKHYIVPSKYKARRKCGTCVAGGGSKKTKNVNKNGRKRTISHGSVFKKSSSQSSKTAISSNTAKMIDSKRVAKSKNNCEKNLMSVKSYPMKQSKSGERNIGATEKPPLSQSGTGLKSKYGKPKTPLKPFNSVFHSETPKGSKHKKSNEKEPLKATIETQTSETNITPKNNIPLCCVIWGRDDEMKNSVTVATCKSKVSSVKTVAGTARKRKTFSANLIRRRRGFWKNGRPMLSNTKSTDNRLTPHLPIPAVEALSSHPSRVVVREQAAPYALRRFLAGSDSSSRRSNPSQDPWSDEILALQRILLSTSMDKKEKEEELPSGLFPITIPIPRKMLQNPASIFLQNPGCPMEVSTGWPSIAGATHSQAEEPNGSIAWSRWPPLRSTAQQTTLCNAATATTSNVQDSATLTSPLDTNKTTVTSVTRGTSVRPDSANVVTRSTSMTRETSMHVEIADAAAGPSTLCVSVKIPTILPSHIASQSTAASGARSPPVMENVPPEKWESVHPVRLEESTSKCLNALTRVSGLTNLLHGIVQRDKHVCKALVYK